MGRCHNFKPGDQFKSEKITFIVLSSLSHLGLCRWKNMEGCIYKTERDVSNDLQGGWGSVFLNLDTNVRIFLPLLH